MDTPMRSTTFHRLLFAATLLTGSIAPAAAQTSDSVATEGFTRRYIDAGSRRSNPVLLRDWPELTRLLNWTRRLETAVAGADETLSAELLEGFRARVDSLAEQPVPGFLTSRRDSVNAAIASVRSRLEEADQALSADPPEVRRADGEAANAPDRERTLVTGRTAVTVPAGVAVGDRDTLPKAAIEGQAPTNFVDYLALALSDLDRLVHLVRTVEINGPPAPSEPAPSPSTARPPRER
ncbi:MAG: hypothetical protein KY397_05655 [Gemmatimonadetes bacterium]|nr:hypothetical protein [Gemmatimonadota bacterium]